MTTGVDKTLSERDARYGEYADNADTSEAMIEIMTSTPGWKRLTSDKKKSLRTIADKMSRILSGDPEYKDNWHDIQGYAKLAEDRCNPVDPNQYPLLTTYMTGPPAVPLRLVLADGVTTTDITSDDVEPSPLVGTIGYQGKTFKLSKTNNVYREVVETHKVIKK